MNRIFLLIMMLGTALGAGAQTRKLPHGIRAVPVVGSQTGPRLIVKQYKGDLRHIDSPFEENGLYGFADSLGKIVIEPQYSYASVFKEGYAVVGRGDATHRKFGLIDRTGREVIPCQWDYVGKPAEGRVFVREGLGHEQKNGYADTAGRIIVPVRYDYARNFKNGAAAVGIGSYERIPEQDWETKRKRYPQLRYPAEPVGDFAGKFGFIDAEGREIVEPVYDKAQDFSELRAAVGKQGKYYIKWGYIDKNGVECIPLDYFSAANFQDGRAVVSRIIGGKPKYGYIDLEGREIVPLEWDYAAPFRFGTMWVGEGEYPACAYTLLDASGKPLIDYKVYELNDSGRLGHVSAAIPDATGTLRYGVLSHHGRIIIPFEYDRITIFSEWDDKLGDYVERGIAELNGRSRPFTLKR